MLNEYELETNTLEWLLASDEPWTRCRTRVDLLGQPAGAPEVQAERAAMLAHPQIQALIARAQRWGEHPLTRHNEAGHPLYALSTLADFGVQASDPGLPALVEAILARQAPQGAFLSPLQIPVAFGGSGAPAWTWAACDAPTLLYTLQALGLSADARVQRAAAHLAGLAEGNGWRCTGGPELGKFKGPGRRSDPCPIATVYALKALARVPGFQDTPAARAGIEMLLGHWEHRSERRYYLFGAGADFRKLKYPFIWYDLLHVLEALSQYPAARADPRAGELVGVLRTAMGEDGRFTAGSMYQAWKGWSFADKKRPSPWLTFLAARILQRFAGG